MNEETRFDGLEEEVINDIVVVDDCDSFGGKRALTVIGIVAGGLGLGLTLFLRNKDKIKQWGTERKIKKLKEQGYTVFRVDDEEQFENVSVNIDGEA